MKTNGTTIHPVKVLCYGYRTSTYQDWSCFKDGNGYREKVKASFDLLVITSDDYDLSDHDIIQKIELLAEPLDCEITAVVQSLDAVNKLIAKNSRFLNTLYHKAVLVYNSGDNDIIVPPVDPSFEEIKNRIVTTWNKCFSTAEQFYKTACFCLDNGWNGKALFDLHQAYGKVSLYNRSACQY